MLAVIPHLLLDCLDFAENLVDEVVHFGVAVAFRGRRGGCGGGCWGTGVEGGTDAWRSGWLRDRVQTGG